MLSTKKQNQNFLESSQVLTDKNERRSVQLISIPEFFRDQDVISIVVEIEESSKRRELVILKINLLCIPHLKVALLSFSRKLEKD